jgi:hypothetical protein
VNENSALRVKVAERKTAVCRAEGGNIVFVSTTTNNNPQGGLLMKRFLGVLIASMFSFLGGFRSRRHEGRESKVRKNREGRGKKAKRRRAKRARSPRAQSRRAKRANRPRAKKAKEKPDSKM